MRVCLGKGYELNFCTGREGVVRFWELFIGGATRE